MRELECYVVSCSLEPALRGLGAITVAISHSAILSRSPKCDPVTTQSVSRDPQLEHRK